MKRTLALLALLPLFVAALASSGCAGKADRTGQSSQGFYAGPIETLWDVSRNEMVRAGYSPNADESSKEALTMVSRWNVNLAAFSGKGYREQATLHFHAVEGREGYWTVEANVLRQMNKELKEPTNPAKVQWDAGTRNSEREARLVYSIETFFLGHDVSPQFRTNYGMPAGAEPIPPPKPAGEPTKPK